VYRNATLSMAALILENSNKLDFNIHALRLAQASLTLQILFFLIVVAQRG
jgi:hypothetical protein